MKKKKSKFWTFCFSLIPGAGEMYLGFMKMGVSIMLLAVAFIWLALMLNISFLIMGVVIVWFYSFFLTLNLSGLSDEEFAEVEDAFVARPSGLKEAAGLFKLNRKAAAYILIIIGGIYTMNSLLSMAYSYLPSPFVRFLKNILYYVPQILVGLAIIFVGAYLIKGKKQELDEEKASEISQPHLIEVAGKEEDAHDGGTV